jgi:hypothetical protein
MAEATEQLTEARKLADEAERAAREKAEQAHQEAERLAGEAQGQAREADARIAEAKRVGEKSSADASRTAAQVRSAGANGDLKERNKEELLDLAAAIDIQGRSRMTKSELVRAIAGSKGGRAKANA